MKEFNFNNQLELGDAGERLLVKAWPRFKKLPGYAADFQDTQTGEKFELKTENFQKYAINQTPNLFIEKLSNEEFQTLGGPWKAQQNGCKYYGHLMINTKLKNFSVFIFETDALVDFLTQNSTKYKTIKIPNRTGEKTWITVGSPVPRAGLSHIYKEVTIGSKTASDFYDFEAHSLKV